eukprot:306172_1
MHNLIYLLDKFNCRFIVDRVGNSTAQRQGSRTHTTSNISNYDPMLGPQTLIAMGFASSDSLNVAQIFGSIVEGAIENLFNASACGRCNTDTTEDDTKSMFNIIRYIYIVEDTKIKPLPARVRKT